MRSDLYQLVFNLDPDFEIVKAKKVDEKWFLEIKAEVEDGTTGLEICKKLNGYNYEDYFSIIGFEKKCDKIYRAIVRRVVNEG